MLIEIGEYAVSKGQADGQWLLFSLTEERPRRSQARKSILQRTPRMGSLARRQAELGKMTRYIQYLEEEIERKNAAIITAEQYQRNLEAELAQARRPKLPWKKHSTGKNR